MGDTTGQTRESPAREKPFGFDQLLLKLYRSVHSVSPWTEFLEELRTQFQASTATLVVRQPASGDRGDIFDVHATRELVDVYRSVRFEDDPFLDLEEGVACNIFDRVSFEEFRRSRFYNELLKLDRNNDILAMNVVFGGSYLGSLKLSRREPAGIFGLAEKSLMIRLYPHLKVALEMFERSRRRHLEVNAYIKAIDQLAFGVIILNERAHVIRVNETASRLMKETQLLRVVGNFLQAGAAEHEVLLGRAIQQALAAGGGGELPGGSLALATRSGEHSVHLLLRPIQEADPEGAITAGGVALFLSSEKLQRIVSIETFARLYDLSKAEVALVAELLEGLSIIEAATHLGISENTARVQLRSVFTKTDTHRQADLMRLVLTSLAIIA
jgi:DNA-binding CsgD family transcriptional regulator/PAS domain-containing protein